MEVLNVNQVQFSSPDSTHSLGSSTCVANHPEWTRDENKIFEQALCEVDHNSQTLYEDISARLPGKTVTEVVRHYLALSHDLKAIESGNCAIPNYEDYKKGIVESDSKEINQPPSSQTNLGRRKKAPNWSKEEHKLFLEGLEKQGRGNWENIAKIMKTKTTSQVMNHAQKHFSRMSKPRQLKLRRRRSIFDIQLEDNRRPPTANKTLEESHDVPIKGKSVFFAEEELNPRQVATSSLNQPVVIKSPRQRVSSSISQSTTASSINDVSKPLSEPSTSNYFMLQYVVTCSTSVLSSSSSSISPPSTNFEQQKHGTVSPNGLPSSSNFESSGLSSTFYGSIPPSSSFLPSTSAFEHQRSTLSRNVPPFPSKPSTSSFELQSSYETFSRNVLSSSSFRPCSSISSEPPQMSEDERPKIMFSQLSLASSLKALSSGFNRERMEKYFNSSKSSFSQQSSLSQKTHLGHKGFPSWLSSSSNSIPQSSLMYFTNTSSSFSLQQTSSSSDLQSLASNSNNLQPSRSRFLQQSKFNHVPQSPGTYSNVTTFPSLLPSTLSNFVPLNHTTKSNISMSALLENIQIERPRSPNFFHDVTSSLQPTIPNVISQQNNNPLRTSIPNIEPQSWEQNSEYGIFSSLPQSSCYFVPQHNSIFHQAMPPMSNFSSQMHGGQIFNYGMSSHLLRPSSSNFISQRNHDFVQTNSDQQLMYWMDKQAIMPENCELDLLPPSKSDFQYEIDQTDLQGASDSNWFIDSTTSLSRPLPYDHPTFNSGSTMNNLLDNMMTNVDNSMNTMTNDKLLDFSQTNYPFHVDQNSMQVGANNLLMNQKTMSNVDFISDSQIIDIPIMNNQLNGVMMSNVDHNT